MDQDIAHATHDETMAAHAAGCDSFLYATARGAGATHDETMAAHAAGCATGRDLYRYATARAAGATHATATHFALRAVEVARGYGYSLCTDGVLVSAGCRGPWPIARALRYCDSPAYDRDCLVYFGFVLRTLFPQPLERLT